MQPGSTLDKQRLIEEDMTKRRGMVVATEAVLRDRLAEFFSERLPEYRQSMEECTLVWRFATHLWRECESRGGKEHGADETPPEDALKRPIIAHWFSVFDMDTSDTITPEEFIECCMEIPQIVDSFTNEELYELYTIFDVDGDQSVTKIEFVAVMEHLINKRPKAPLREIREVAQTQQTNAMERKARDNSTGASTSSRDFTLEHRSIDNGGGPTMVVNTGLGPGSVNSKKIETSTTDHNYGDGPEDCSVAPGPSSGAKPAVPDVDGASPPFLDTVSCLESKPGESQIYFKDNAPKAQNWLETGLTSKVAARPRFGQNFNASANRTGGIKATDGRDLNRNPNPTGGTTEAGSFAAWVPNVTQRPMPLEGGVRDDLRVARVETGSGMDLPQTTTHRNESEQFEGTVNDGAPLAEETRGTISTVAATLPKGAPHIPVSSLLNVDAIAAATSNNTENSSVQSKDYHGSGLGVAPM